MPIYTYGCDDTDHWFEQTKPMKDRNEEEVCPTCGEPALLRPSLTLPHIWEEKAARNIECRSGSKEVHTGTMPDGTPFRTIGGPPPPGIIKDHS